MTRGNVGTFGTCVSLSTQKPLRELINQGPLLSGFVELGQRIVEKKMLPRPVIPGHVSLRWWLPIVVMIGMSIPRVHGGETVSHRRRLASAALPLDILANVLR